MNNNLSNKGDDGGMEQGVPIAQIEELLKTFMSICSRLGFGRENKKPSLGDSLVVYQKQVFKPGYSLDLTVHRSNPAAATNSYAFNLIYNRYLQERPAISIGNEEVDRIVAQVATAENQEVSLANYRQFMLQIYLAKPHSYQSEDYLYRVRIEQQKSGPRLTIGVPWMAREMQLNTQNARETVNQLANLPV